MPDILPGMGDGFASLASGHLGITFLLKYEYSIKSKMVHVERGFRGLPLTSCVKVAETRCLRKYDRFHFPAGGPQGYHLKHNRFWHRPSKAALANGLPLIWPHLPSRAVPGGCTDSRCSPFPLVAEQYVPGIDRPKPPVTQLRPAVPAGHCPAVE